MNFIKRVQFNIKKAIKITGRGRTSSEAIVIIQVKGDDSLYRLVTTGDETQSDFGCILKTGPTENFTSQLDVGYKEELS